MTAATWGSDAQMNELESTMWRAERHPANSSQGCVIEILETTPSWDEMLRVHHAGLAAFPRFKQRVVEPAVPVAPPVWADDEGFDLAYHLRRVVLRAPGTQAQFLEVAQAHGVSPLDRTRPLWAALFVEGLEGGRSAYVLCVHHCLMDGVGSVQLLSQLQSTPGVSPAAASTEPPSDNPIALAGRQALDRVADAPGQALRALGSAAGAVSRPRESARFAASVGRVLKPPPASPSHLLNRGTRRAWRYGMLDCSLAELKAAGKAAGGSINDAYVCAILGGLRRYHEAHGAEIGDITVNMPVNVRREGDAEGGNRFAVAFISAPSSVVDPAERIAELRRVVSGVQTEPALDFFSILLPALNRAPTALLTPLFTDMQARADLTASNVAGMTTSAAIAGAPVDAMYYFGPLPGSAVTTVLCSHHGRCYIGVNCDGDVFEDPEQLVALLREALEEVLALVR